MPRFLLNVGAIQSLRDLAVRHLTAKWIEALKQWWFSLLMLVCAPVTPSMSYRKMPITVKVWYDFTHSASSNLDHSKSSCWVNNSAERISNIIRSIMVFIVAVAKWMCWNGESGFFRVIHTMWLHCFPLCLLTNDYNSCIEVNLIRLIHVFQLW